MRQLRLPKRPDLQGESPYGAPQLEVPIRLNVNENPYPPSPQVLESMENSLREALQNLNRYPDRDFLQLRQALSRYLATESKVEIDPENIWAANGSNEVILQILQAFAGPGRVVASFSPTYSMYPEYARDTFSTFVTGQRKPDFSIDLAEVKRVLATHRPSVILLASPNNPTGTALQRAELEEILQLTRNTGPKQEAENGELLPTCTLVVVDEAYGEFRREDTPSALQLLKNYPHLVVCRTLSKAFGAAGLRLGYLAASTEIIEQIRLIRLPYHLSALTQAAACGALAQSTEQMRQVQQIRSDRDKIVAQLQERGFQSVPSDANFVFFGTFTDRHRIWQGLLERGVLIREVGPDGWLRASVGTPAENTAFLQALKEVSGK